MSPPPDRQRRRKLSPRAWRAAPYNAFGDIVGAALPDSDPHVLWFDANLT